MGLFRRLFVTCGVFTRYFFVALFCLEKQCSGLFRYFFVAFSWLFRFGQILRVLALEQSSEQFFPESGEMLIRVAKTFACYRGHLGPSGRKSQTEFENGFLGPSRPRGPKSPKRSRKRVKID